MRGRFGNRVSPRFAGYRPPRQWHGVQGQFLLSAVTATAQSTIIGIESPGGLQALTSDPPEDLTVMRMRGEFTVLLDATAEVTRWTLALLVQDTTWTPSSSFGLDSDKRVLWSRTYSVNAEAVTYRWDPPGYASAGATTFFTGTGHTELDIAPKVKVEPGKALLLVAYLNTAGNRALTVSSDNMRVLIQRSKRR